MFAKSPVSPPVSLAFGAAMLFAAFFFGEKQLTLLQDGKHISGTIARIHWQEENVDGRPCCKYYPVIDFTDSTGAKITFTADRGSAYPDKFKAGDSMPVVYLQSDPGLTAQIDTGYDALFVPGIFAVFGLLFLLGGLPKQQSETL
ncbi:MAG: DUF3592 domain-containing protein [Alphaproteobacteria bacterium]|nr:DUF3592 domain-containing protein [Alphaproteobacteria bacterium]